ncbi:ABC transporter ATP-binding protein [Microlunatus speluncae]|uniref:ABC transporter ATP-binding protein n=1 Tax=Microlunatus speluncae TaxID=2594267 RepID=UPI0012666678|nr:ATP-binding cassette domain-containing protein [Microlunatus speluncae]
MITLTGLTKRYGRTTAVDELTVSVRPGVVTGFLGPNGAGKSTTMRMIVGLDRPTAGTALIDGRPYPALRDPLREVGALLDTTVAHPGRTATAHLAAIAAAGRIPRRRVAEVLELVGLTAVAGRRTRDFSLGMTQRLGIAAALLGDPPVLLFDEPVNGLDPDGVRWIRGLIRSLAAEGRTVLVSSHLMSEMEDTADQLIVLGRGRLIADAPLPAVIAAASRNAIRVRTPEPGRFAAALRDTGWAVEIRSDHELLISGATLVELGDLAFRHQVRLHELATRSASLEEAYLELTGDSVDYRAEPVPSSEQEPRR